MLAFGPVPSRRLGLSLGINNLPPKTCTYACVYCQLGTAPVMPPVPAGFFSAAEIQAAVAEQVERVRRKNQSIDYLTFFPSGEPTLDMNLEPMITQLKALGFKHRGHYQRLAAVAVKGKICIIAGRLGLAKSRCSQCSYLAPHQPPSQRSSFSTHYGCDT